MVQVVFYQKNTGSTTKEGGNRQKNTNWVKIAFFICSHRTPIPYRILKTRANDGITDVQPKKHGPRVQIGGTVDKKTTILTFLHFLTSRTTPLDPTGRKKQVR